MTRLKIIINADNYKFITVHRFSIQNDFTRGMTIADIRARSKALPNTSVLLDFSVDKFKEIVINTIGL